MATIDGLYAAGWSDFWDGPVYRTPEQVRRDEALSLVAIEHAAPLFGAPAYWPALREARAFWGAKPDAALYAERDRLAGMWQPDDSWLDPTPPAPLSDEEHARIVEDWLTYAADEHPALPRGGDRAAPSWSHGSGRTAATD